MTDDEIQLVQSTWRQVVPHGEEFACLFYEKLFLSRPEFICMFKQDLSKQRQKFVGMVTIAVESLIDIVNLQPVLKELGQRHIIYGVQDYHYKAAGDALLWSLDETLGETLTPQSRLAWIAFYNFVAKTMQAQTNL